MVTDATPTEYSVAIQIYAVMRAAYALEAERIGVAEFPPLRESLEQLRQSSDRFLVFERSGSIIGGLSDRRGTDAVAITRLVVSPVHLRQGIATALLSALEHRLSPVTRLTVSTAAGNAPALSLYKRLGFKTAGTSTSGEGISLLHLFKPSAVATWSIATVVDTSAPGCDLVRQWLREHNWSVDPAFMGQLQRPEHQAQPLVLLATANSRVVGGLFAETQLAWLRISTMAVQPELRSQGIGAALLADAERQAVARGCKYAYVDTMEHQAPRFYLSHGFSTVGKIPDWDSHGHTKFHLTKHLTQC